MKKEFIKKKVVCKSSKHSVNMASVMRRWMSLLVIGFREHLCIIRVLYQARDCLYEYT